MLYYGVEWHRDDHDDGPCPLVIHFDTDDVAAADLADPKKLASRGWTHPADDHSELAIAMRPRARILERRGAGYVVTATSVDERLTCVALTATEGAGGIAVSIQGRRVSLPAPEAELIRALGAPNTRKLGPGGK